MVNKNIIYIKTPKCGSTSVKHQLLDYSRKHGMKVLAGATGFKNEHNLKSPYLSNLSKNNIFAQKHNNGNYNISLSHVTATDDNISRLVNIMEKKDYLLISSIREPLDRLISNYMGTPHTPQWDKTEMGFTKWYLNNKDKNVKQIYGNLERFFPDFWMNNFLCNYLNIDINSDDPLKKYDFITITEHYSESMKNLSKLLGYDFKVEVKNETKPFNISELVVDCWGRPQGGIGIGKKFKLDDLSDEIKKMYREDNLDDYKLYDMCLNRFL